MIFLTNYVDIDKTRTVINPISPDNAHMIWRIACIGSGVIGHSWATLLVAKGHSVNLYGRRKESLARALSNIERNLKFLLAEGLIKEDMGRALSRVSFTMNMNEALKDVDLALESVAESYELKKEFFRKIDSMTAPHVILATSTSGLLMTEIQKGLTYPERCIIIHPVNPPHLIPLVEIVPGERTSKEVIQSSFEFMKALGKVPVILKKEVPGFLVNRLQAVIWREAIDLVDKEVASLEDVERAVKDGLGLRWAFMGPNLTLHVGGGAGGLKKFIAGVGRTYSNVLSDLNCWTSIPKSAATKVLDQIEDLEVVRGKSVEDLMVWRDEKLVRVMKAIYDVNQGSLRKEKISHTFP